jgi:dTDP-4-dehydrorhamnose reductase
MKKVLILGGTGMLGSAVSKVFLNETNLEVLMTARSPLNGHLEFDARDGNLAQLLETTQPDFIVNCIGIIKPHISELEPKSIENAIDVNAQFPIHLSNLVSGTNTKVIQIATDCVYSGSIGNYVEESLHDATDVYGKTKSLGEVPSSNFMHLRASIIGPEVGRSTSLLEWFRNQPIKSEIKGFTNHSWNGLTTHQFAKISLGIVNSGNFTSGSHHIIPRDIVSKFELLTYFAKTYSREDILISAVESQVNIDRTLATSNPNLNLRVWSDARYNSIPTISEMIQEQANF